jgi:hypothetical protein
MKVPARLNASGAQIRHKTLTVVLLIIVATPLDLSAVAGLAYLAGFSRVRAALGQFSPVWPAALAGALGISFVGYYYAYRGVFTIEDGPNLTGDDLVLRCAAARRGHWRVYLPAAGLLVAYAGFDGCSSYVAHDG